MTADWSLPSQVFDFLEPRIRGLYVVELGSGKGSARLSQMCAELTSVEHDPDYVTLYPPDARARGAKCIHAPIDPATGWYSRAALEESLPRKIDAVIVDGPPGNIGRHGLMKHLDLFPDVPFLFDDTHRAAERELAISYWKVRKGHHIGMFHLPDGRGFTAVGWPL
jgi:hypothetical protein